MDLELEGRVAIVTGASRGIGLATVRALAAAGARVVAGARRFGTDLDDLAETGAVQRITVDLGTADGPATLVAAAGDRIDILVNNVGGAPPRTDGFLSVTDAQWQHTLELNLLTAVRTTRAAVPAMIAAGGGSIISVGSVNATLPEALVIDYSAAKAALIAFSKALSKELGAHGIRVNTISPGPVATDLWLAADGVAATVGKASGTDPGAVAAGAAASTVTGRFSTPDEVAALALVLAGDRAANITGADFRIDGGYIPTW
ncbi:SDR family NAD(P)-dependent oxidoreductase [Nocardia aurantia]|uniref:3-oxoacyl-[acyl-carrier-protein] reductase MabA n=1 Tax=Nocardia aurantia TaxID=2585199 RepID=A0A7K0DT50_9NOCA|nr:SDR family NAD(P)-dependent oxidoreductase [Nocardia aurantia]MQY28931.1 3-oxoacyl-[acyl-carrier-protein] reductase FabG [Nocardia aurantia]